SFGLQPTSGSPTPATCFSPFRVRSAVRSTSRRILVSTDAGLTSDAIGGHLLSGVVGGRGRGLLVVELLTQLTYLALEQPDLSHEPVHVAAGWEVQQVEPLTGRTFEAAHQFVSRPGGEAGENREVLATGELVHPR